MMVPVSGDLVYYDVMGKVLYVFSCRKPQSSETYVTRVYAGITDNYDNEIEINQSFSFQTGNIDFEIIEIDNLENSVMCKIGGHRNPLEAQRVSLQIVLG